MGIRALDLFCGGGGSSWGAQSAGAEIAGGIDAWDVAAETFGANFPTAKVFTTSLTESTDPAEFDGVGPIDLLLASPECTNHTCARGSRPRNEASRRTAHYVTAFARHFNPRWVVVENVTSMRRWHGYDVLVGELEELGYHVTPQVLEAAWFGVPQTRKRLFLMCDREVKPAELSVSRIRETAARSILAPDGTYKSRPLYLPGRAENTIARYRRGLRQVGAGENFLLVYYGTDGSGGWQSLDMPLRTMTTLDRFGLVSWKGRRPYLRMLQPDELLRAMGFDRCNAGRRFGLSHGSRRDRIRILGNGVSPPVMEKIVSSLVSAEMVMAAE